MKPNVRSFWALTRLSILFCLFAVLLLPLKSSFCAVGHGKANGDISISLQAGKGTGKPGRHYVSFYVSIWPTTRAITIARSSVMVNRTTPIPLNTALSRMGRLHVHERRIEEGDALGSSVTLEVFVRETGWVGGPDTLARRIAAAIIDLRPTIDWVYPTRLSTVNIHGDHSVSPPSYPPLRVTWGVRGASGPYVLMVRKIGPGSTEVFHESGILTNSHSLPASIFESGKQYEAFVRLAESLPIRATTSFVFAPGTGFLPHATVSFTVVKD